MGSDASKPESGPSNPLDIDARFHFDHEKHSPGVIYGEHYQSVTFRPGPRQQQYAFFHQTLQKNSTESLKLRMKVRCGKQSSVVVGFSERQPPADLAQVTKDNLYLFDVTGGKVHLKGFHVKGVELPSCEDGGVVELDVSQWLKNICYSVDNAHGSLSQPMDMCIDEEVADKVWPLVGVLGTGSEEVVLQLVGTSRSMASEEAMFDRSTTCGPLTVSPSGKVVSRDNVSSNCCVVVNKILTKGRHRWTLLVHQDVGASTCLGIARSPFCLPEHFCKSSKHIYRHSDLMMWRSYRGFLYADGHQLPKTLEPLNWQQHQSTKVEFELDLDKGTLGIFRNGTSLGIAFEKVKPPVQPAIAFYAGYEKSVELYHFETEKQLAQHSDPVRLKIEHVPKPLSKLEFHFDLNHSSGELGVSEDGSVVYRKNNQQGNAYCLLNVQCREGVVYRWSLLVESDQGASTCVGITTTPVDVPSKVNIYNSKTMYLYRSFQGMLYAQGRELQKRVSEFWSNGTLVELILDLVNGVLQFVVDGEDQGVAFCNLTGTFYPIVAFYAGMEKKVSLQHFEQTEPSPKLVKKQQDLNDLNKSDKEAETKAQVSQLPLRLQSTDIKLDSCMVCGVKDGNVASLPCKHAIFCAAHVVTDGSQRCLVCDQPIKGVWNLF